MNFKDMLDKLSTLSEATKETEKGRIHKAEPGGYGRKYDTDDEGEEVGDKKDAKKPEEKRGRGRPSKTGAHVSKPEDKKKQKEKEEAGKNLQSYISGKPKKSKELEKLPKKKHSLKEFFDQIDQERMIKEATPGQVLQVKPMQGAAQLVDPASGRVVATGKADKINAMQKSMAQGEVQMPGKMEEEKGEKWIQKAIKHPGAFTAKAKAAGKSVSAFAKEKKHAPGTLGKQARLAQTLRKINKEDVNMMEVEQPTIDNMTAMGAGLGAGRSDRSLEEAKKTVKKDNKAEVAGKKVAKDIEYDEKVKDKIHGKKRHAEDEKAEKAGKKVAKDIEYDEKKKKQVKEAAKPDFPDIDNDKNTEEPISKAAKDAKKKKMNESGHRHSAARLMGKAHALAKEGYNCKYEDMEEAKMYHEGYKEGLDECYGLMPMRGVVVGETPAATVPGMASQAMPAMEDDLDEMDKSEWMRHKAKTTPGDTFKAFGQTMRDKDVLETDSFAFESLDQQLNDLLIEGEKVEEGMSVSISKGQQGAPDSVTVSAQDAEAEKLLSFIKQAGLGLFADDNPANFVSTGQGDPTHDHGDISVVDDHDGMMSIMKKMAGMDQGGDDYRDEEHHDDHDHDHSDKNHDETCNECGYMESQCKCDEEMVDEVESYDQEEEKVAEADHESMDEAGELDEIRRLAGAPHAATAADSKRGMQEDNPPDSGEAESTADEDAEAAEDKALALKSVNEGGDGGEASEEPEKDMSEGLGDNLKKAAAAGILGLGLAAGGMGSAKAAPDQMKTAAVQTVKQDQFKGAPTLVAGKHFSIPAGAGSGGKMMAFFGSGPKSHKYELKQINSLDQAPAPGPRAQYVYLKMPDQGFGGKTVKAYAPDEMGTQLFVLSSTNESKLDEWANDAGKRGTETTFVTDEDYMINTISSGLNKRKSTGQTTIPVIPGQKERMGVDSLREWKRLAGI